mmetsp:Transcript_113576/g.316003  ORF Transcript_113576/g.316003 Transcript_113576/m.316003 type:complete len:361 (-) Transcript_113576:31-1113(-)
MQAVPPREGVDVNDLRHLAVVAVDRQAQGEHPHALRQPAVAPRKHEDGGRVLHHHRVEARLEVEGQHVPGPAVHPGLGVHVDHLDPAALRQALRLQGQLANADHLHVVAAPSFVELHHSADLAVVLGRPRQAPDSHGPPEGNRPVGRRRERRRRSKPRRLGRGKTRRTVAGGAAVTAAEHPGSQVVDAASAPMGAGEEGEGVLLASQRRPKVLCGGDAAPRVRDAAGHPGEGGEEILRLLRGAGAALPGKVAAASARPRRVRAEQVVLPPLLRVAEHAVGLGDAFEHLLCSLRVIGILIRMVLQRQPLVRLDDLAVAGTAADAQQAVVVVVCGRGGHPEKGPKAAASTSLARRDAARSHS